MASSTCGQTDPVISVASGRRRLPAAYHSDPTSSGARGPGGGGGLSMSSIGTVTRRSNDFEAGGATMSTGAAPPRNRAASSIGRTVADSPMRWAGRSSNRSSRSRLSARCAPRLVAATACTSSTMTVCTPRSVRAAWLVSIRYSDSGVVIRMSGGSCTRRRRSLDGVSPERTPTVTSGSAIPSRRAD